MKIKKIIYTGNEYLFICNKNIYKKEFTGLYSIYFNDLNDYKIVNNILFHKQLYTKSCTNKTMTCEFKWGKSNFNPITKIKDKSKYMKYIL
jgi:hypothetical protein